MKRIISAFIVMILILGILPTTFAAGAVSEDAYGHLNASG